MNMLSLNKTVTFHIIMLLLGIVIPLSGCQKDFLEKKPNRSSLVPSTIANYQALLDNSLFISAPGLQETTADDFTISDAGLQALEPIQINAYKWSNNMFAGLFSVPDWGIQYQQVFTCNLILEGIEKLDPQQANTAAYNQVKGSALFNRAFSFYNLVQLFAAPYTVNTAGNMPGIPIRLSSDVNARYPRGTVQQTYDQVLKDLTAALPLLPDQVFYKSRPCKAAALALFARIYLTMGDYERAGDFAAQTLKIRPDLIDYNSITGSATVRLFPAAEPNGNIEVICFKTGVSYTYPALSPLVSVVPSLYDSYNNDDLRKTLFFRNRGNGVLTFRGNYGGAINTNVFNGLATDEMYLIHAECTARLGNIDVALADLNKLLINRFVTGKFMPYTTRDQNELLRLILGERRKELVCRDLRWTDLRRLNLESSYAIELSRTVGGQVYKLPSNSSRYTFPIPDDDIQAGGIEQNP